MRWLRPAEASTQIMLTFDYFMLFPNAKYTLIIFLQGKRRVLGKKYLFLEINNLEKSLPSACLVHQR